MAHLRILAIPGALLPGVAVAHTATGAAAGGGAAVCSLDPWVGVPMLIAAVLYSAGLARLWASSGVGRGAPAWQVALYAAGFVMLALALFSPLDLYAGDLFSAHMTQHQLLMIVAAPLMVLGRPGPVFLWSLPRRWRRGFGRMPGRSALQAFGRGLSRPVPAWLLFLVALWGWHVPALYESAVEDLSVHRLQHVSFIGAALVYWRSVFSAAGRAADYGVGFLSTFSTGLHCSALGALLTFTTRPWYPVYSDDTAAYGLSPLEDQQLGGLIMWVPSGVVFLAAGLALIAAWLNAAEARVGANEAQPALSAAPAETRPELR